MTGLYNKSLVINELIRDAHPFGGTDINVNQQFQLGDGKVEDIIEQHLKMLQIAYTQPTVQVLANLANEIEGITPKTAMAVDEILKTFVRQAAVPTKSGNIARSALQYAEALHNDIVKPIYSSMMGDIGIEEEGDREQVKNWWDMYNNQLLTLKKASSTWDESFRFENIKKDFQKFGKTLLKLSKRWGGLQREVSNKFWDKDLIEIAEYRPYLLRIREAGMTFLKLSSAFEQKDLSVARKILSDLGVSQPTSQEETKTPSVKNKELQEDVLQPTVPSDKRKEVSRKTPQQAIKTKSVLLVKTIQKFLKREETGIFSEDDNEALYKFLDSHAKNKASKYHLVADYIMSNELFRLSNSAEQNADGLNRIFKLLKTNVLPVKQKEVKRHNTSTVEFVSPVTGKNVQIPFDDLLQIGKKSPAKFVEKLQEYGVLHRNMTPSQIFKRDSLHQVAKALRKKMLEDGLETDLANGIVPWFGRLNEKGKSIQDKKETVYEFASKFWPARSSKMMTSSSAMDEFKRRMAQHKFSDLAGWMLLSDKEMHRSNRMMVQDLLNHVNSKIGHGSKTLEDPTRSVRNKKEEGLPKKNKTWPELTGPEQVATVKIVTPFAEKAAKEPNNFRMYERRSSDALRKGLGDVLSDFALKKIFNFNVAEANKKLEKSFPLTKKPSPLPVKTEEDKRKEEVKKKVKQNMVPDEVLNKMLNTETRNKPLPSSNIQTKPSFEPITKRVHPAGKPADLPQGK